MKKQKPKRKILAALLCLLVVFCCTACGGKSKEEAQTACEDFFQAYSSCDSQALADSMEGLSTPAPFTDIQRGMAENLQFETKKVKNQGDILKYPYIVYWHSRLNLHSEIAREILKG